MPLFFFIAVDAFFAGIAAAWLARTYLASPVRVIGEWAVLRHAENPGIAFGVRLPSPFQEILILCALSIVAAVAFRAKTAASRVAYGLIVGGALANVVDRIGDGKVTDYFAVGTFPVFNVPDSCISVGVALILAESTGMFRFGKVKF